MKKVIIMLVCLMTMTISANGQTNALINNFRTDSLYALTNTTSYQENLEILKEPLINSAKFLKKSATFDYIEIGLLTCGGALAISSSCSNNETFKNLGYIVGGTMGVFAIVCHLESIYYKSKSGKCLEFYGNGIKYIF